MNPKNNNTYIKFEQVKKSYDGKNLVIKELNLEVKKGEFLTLLGPSGSGKSTCLMMLSGFEAVSSGEIYINHQPIACIPTHQRNIGMVFQNYALFPHMTVAQNLAYPLKFRAFDKKTIKTKVAEFLDLVQLTNLAKRYPAQLSGGQQQRVALARALIYSPELVLMDEPLGALDRKLRDKMQYEIRTLHKLLGFTMIYVTHDQNEALTMSDRVLVFNEGVVQQLSDTKTLYHHPNNEFVAQFIGENNGFLVDFISQTNNNSITVKLDKSKILATSSNLFNKKSRLKLFVRPENISIKRLQNQHSNQLSGIILQLIFAGDYYRIVVKLPSDDDIIIKYYGQLNSELCTGSPLNFYFSAQQCVVLPTYN